MTRYLEGQTIPYETRFENALGEGITTATGVMSLRRTDDDQYFEDDSSELRKTVVKHVLSMLTTDQREELAKQIESGVDEAFDLFNDLVEETIGTLMSSKPTTNLWKLGMGPDEIEKYSKLNAELRTRNQGVKVTMQKILDAQLDREQKCKLINLFDALQSMRPYSPEYLFLSLQINAIIEAANHTKFTPEQMEAFSKKEAELKKIIGTDMPLRLRILTAELDDERKAAIYSRYLLLQKTPADSISAANLEEWIEEALKTPFTKVQENLFDLQNPGQVLIKLKEGFQEHLSEMDTVLEPLLTVFNNCMHQPNAKSPVLGFLGSPGVGKCLGFNTLVLMYDGSIKMVQDIKVGERLMGDDSSVRNVLSVTTGQEMMYRIEQGYGDSYRVNESHILSLKLSRSARIQDRQNRQSFIVSWFGANGTYSKSFSYKDCARDVIYAEAIEFCQGLPHNGDIIDIPLREYLKRTISWKTSYKGYKIGVDYNEQSVPLDPYLLGCWLGDGTSAKPHITSIDQEIIDAFRVAYPELTIRPDNTGITYMISSGSKGGSPEIQSNRNPFWNALKELDVVNNKHIPKSYLINSRSVRKKLLAGLIDTDGYKARNACYEITQKNKTLATNILTLGRSLGYKVTIRQVTKSCIYKGEKRMGIYQRLFISGADDLPVKLKRKISDKKRTDKNTLVYNIDVIPEKVDNYYGFQLDGNHRFLLGDFTVTHNTAAGQVIAQVWGVPFQQISLGGLVDSTILDGKHPGWVGSSSGRFAKALQEMGVINGVLFLDEIDKLGETPHGLEVQYSLLHSTDPVQNSHYNDHYLGSKLPLDLSKCLIICALNKTEGLDPALLNRMHIIKVPDYTGKQKTKIMLKHLFPLALQNAGLSTEEISLPADTCSVIQNRVEQSMGKEGGVRGVKACIRMIVDKLSLLIHTSDDDQKRLNLTFKVNVKNRPVVITPAIVDELYKSGDLDSIPQHLYL